MSYYFVSRHQGAKEWALHMGLAIDQFLDHLDVSIVNTGDQVIGTLPIHLIAELTDIGASYYHLTLNVPLEYRGADLSLTQLLAFKPELVEYTANRVKTINPFKP